MKTFASSLWSEPAFWDMIADVGFWLVFFGVVGEAVGLPVFRKLSGLRRQGWIRAVYSRRTSVELVSWFILCVGLGAEFIGGYESRKMSHSQNISLERDLELLKERQRPRVLNPAQMANIKSALTGNASGHVVFLIDSSSDDAEGYAESIEGVLKAVGYDMTSPRVPVVSGAGSEISVFARPGDDEKEARKVHAAFTAAGMIVESPADASRQKFLMGPHADFSESTVIIVVGKRGRE